MTGVVFGLLTIAHIWRGIVEPELLKEPWFILITLFTFGFSIWSVRLLKR